MISVRFLLVFIISLINLYNAPDTMKWNSRNTFGENMKNKALIMETADVMANEGYKDAATFAE